jgi:hypothetical protein
MINPLARPYLAEELEVILRSQSVQTKKLPDLVLEKEVIPVQEIVDSEKLISPIANKKAFWIAGIIILVGGAIGFIAYVNFKKNKSKQSSKPLDSGSQHAKD